MKLFKSWSDSWHWPLTSTPQLNYSLSCQRSYSTASKWFSSVVRARHSQKDSRRNINLFDMLLWTIHDSWQRDRWMQPCIVKKSTGETKCSKKPGSDIFEMPTQLYLRLSLSNHLPLCLMKTSSLRLPFNTIFLSAVISFGWSVCSWRTRKRTRKIAFPWCASSCNAFSVSAINASLI